MSGRSGRSGRHWNEEADCLATASSAQFTKSPDECVTTCSNLGACISCDTGAATSPPLPRPHQHATSHCFDTFVGCATRALNAILGANFLREPRASNARIFTDLMEAVIKIAGFQFNTTSDCAIKSEKIIYSHTFDVYRYFDPLNHALFRLDLLYVMLSTSKYVFYNTKSRACNYANYHGWIAVR
jgi:hypothetical protein